MRVELSEEVGEVVDLCEAELELDQHFLELVDVVPRVLPLLPQLLEQLASRCHCDRFFRLVPLLEDEDQLEQVVLLLAGLQEPLEGVVEQPVEPFRVVGNAVPHQGRVKGLGQLEQFLNCASDVMVLDSLQQDFEVVGLLVRVEGADLVELGNRAVDIG